MILLFCALLALSVPSLAAAPGLNHASSTITANFRQMNVPVSASFKDFDGHISYEAAHPVQAVASISVQTASFDMGDEDYNAEVRKKEWFDSTSFPTATFESTSIKAVSAQAFEATGKLTVKGIAEEVTVPVKVSAADGGSAFDGSLKLSRALFKIGGAEWKDTVDDTVVVNFHIVTKAP